MQGKQQKSSKRLALRRRSMYQFCDNQLRFEDFEQPIGMKMNRENRWVKRAEMIPWEEIELRYAALFKNKKGNVAKPLRLALGACLIQADYDYSDEEVVLQIQEAGYLQFFCGYRKYDDTKPPFDPSLMVYFRKRLTPEILGEINELVIENATKEESTKDDDDQPKPQNQGTMIVDATCAPSQIKFPQDTELLNQARECTEKLIDEIHNPAEGKKPRTYRKQARKDYLSIARCKKKSTKKLRKAIGQQLNYLRRNLGYLKDAVLSEKQQEKLEVITTLYKQQKAMHDNRTHSIPDRIVSLHQPWLRPIVRGKAKAAVEFGAKLDISVVDGFTRLEYHSFDAYNESTKLQETVERYKQRTGSYPERILADKIYRNRDNLNFCKEHGIRLSGPALGRPKKDEVRDKQQDYRDESERVEVERKFSLAKRKCGMGLIVTKLKETSCHCLAMSILLLNLRQVLCAFFEWIYGLARFEKIAFIQ